MFGLFKKKKRASGGSAEKMGPSSESRVLASSLHENVEIVRKIFQDVDILRVKYIDNSCVQHLHYCILFCDGVVNAEIIHEDLIKPLQNSPVAAAGRDLLDTVTNQIVQIGETKKTDQISQIIEAIAYGDTVLFVEGQDQAILLNTKCFETRGISEPDNEKGLIGPRDGFTESLMSNLSMIRRRALTADLKMKIISLGRRTHTKACICYMEGIVNKRILSELYKRLDTIDIDGVLDVNYITELIKDSPWSPFRATGYTERPDVVMGKILEGRIALFLDGTPVVLTIPYLFIENFQSSEDYYLSFFYSSFSRMLRILGFVLTITVPGAYVSISAFHHEMFPLSLFINIASERQSVPLSAAVEAFGMIILFDILRETGVRMPSTIGQALSIVGALVIGQAAVEAKLVAAPMIIVIALTGITGLLVPKLNAPALYIRLLLLTLSSTFGFFGLMLGLSGVLIHILNLHSFGVPQIMFSKKLHYQNVKDTFIRAPWWQMIRRPVFAEDKIRLKGGRSGND